MGEINFFPDDLEVKDQKIILRLDLNAVSYTHLRAHETS